MSFIPNGHSDSTRERLLLAAAVIFDSQGFGQARLDDICQAIGVTKGALYCHFPSKDALALALLERRMAAWHRQSGGLRTHRPDDVHRLQNLIDLSYAALLDLRHDPVARAAHRVLFQDRVFDLVGGMHMISCVTLVHDLLDEANQRGELRREVDLREAAEGIMAAALGVQTMSRATSDYEDLPERLEAMWRVWIPHLAVPSCRAALRLAPQRGTSVPAVALSAGGDAG
ncbi:ScbR family autoregulator-binding transcription factor [Allokutzneria albata]|uniref:DNA-binding transcriptional regulator, AcrR family n=1 Tax=Allokutzneria albata TaxID=211114 RepID=A0A1G9V8V0_ALLAB|nr:ScbR family autoregulator-binding transcription factor [Allokutzneria albata]SDM68510.1 DNA-binding transcriptional regulator, AcrR family [Allokutzneria albata]